MLGEGLPGRRRYPTLGEGDRERLDDPSPEIPPKLDMGAALGMNREAKPTEDGGDLCAR